MIISLISVLSITFTHQNNLHNDSTPTLPRKMSRMVGKRAGGYEQGTMATAIPPYDIIDFKTPH